MVGTDLLNVRVGVRGGGGVACSKEEREQFNPPLLFKFSGGSTIFGG